MKNAPVQDTNEGATRTANYSKFLKVSAPYLKKLHRWLPEIDFILTALIFATAELLVIRVYACGGGAPW